MTYEEMFIGVINYHNRPLKFKELLRAIQGQYKPDVKCETIRQALVVTCKKEVVVRVKIAGTASFYCKPEWTFRSRIKGKFNFNPYWNNKLNHESKSIQVQQSSDSLGRATRLPIQQGEANP